MAISPVDVAVPDQAIFNEGPPEAGTSPHPTEQTTDQSTDPAPPYDENYQFLRDEIALSQTDPNDFGKRLDRRIRRWRCRNEIIRALDLSPGSTILDVGACTGRSMALVRELGGLTVYGLDLNLAAIKWGMEQYGVDTNVNASAACIPFPDKTFDAVYSQDLLEHLQPHLLAMVFAQMARVCLGKLMVQKVTTVEDKLWIDADPTHQTKQTAEWWADFFARQGWEPIARTRRFCGFNRNPRHALVFMHGYFLLERQQG
jgi:SAM-dependent methyltransferase